MDFIDSFDTGQLLRPASLAERGMLREHQIVRLTSGIRNSELGVNSEELGSANNKMKKK